MLATLLTLMVGVLGGLAVGLQSPIAGAISQKVGGASSSLIIHLSGAFFSMILLALRGGENIREWRTLPPYMLVAGALGVVLYLSLSRTLPELGAGTALTLIILGQLAGGLVIDHFGWFGVTVRPVDLSRGLAVIFLLVGGYLMVR